ncbi:nosL-related protein [hydrothermal vent metagenome]|uniref:NosL-related protein n=1 Tax=hydrothermal vent metagenome TaxID=652676 RepID=A0A1W1CC86_9ZZZZ
MIKRVLSIAVILSLHLGADDMRLSKKGQKIVESLCDKGTLPKRADDIEQMMIDIKSSSSCPPLSKSKLKAVAHYLLNGVAKSSVEKIVVPKDAKCPVCGMFVHKYPKWTTLMVIDGKKLYFDGVKDMMKYYIFDGDFVYERKSISSMRVSDYYTLESIDAKDAYYVYDSNMFGPMGRELVPFKSKKEAETFMSDHSGKSILRFGDISDSLIMGLDG